MECDSGNGAVAALRRQPVQLVGICFAALILLDSPALSATYPGIPPYSNLNDVRAVFPGAVFEELQAGWLKPTDKLIQVSSIGRNGSLVMKVVDYRPKWKSKLVDARLDWIILKKEAKRDEMRKYEAMCNYPDDKAYVVAWVRFVPDSPLAPAILFDRYGRPKKKGVNENLSRFLEWTNGPYEGLYATLGGDGKVSLLDFNPTYAELKKYQHLLDRVFNTAPKPTPSPTADDLTEPWERNWKPADPVPHSTPAPTEGPATDS